MIRASCCDKDDIYFYEMIYAALVVIFNFIFHAWLQVVQVPVKLSNLDKYCQGHKLSKMDWTQVLKSIALIGIIWQAITRIFSDA